MNGEEYVLSPDTVIVNGMLLTSRVQPGAKLLLVLNNAAPVPVTVRSNDKGLVQVTADDNPGVEYAKSWRAFCDSPVVEHTAPERLYLRVLNP